MSEITLLLAAVDRGETRAAEELLPLVYDELRHLAAARMNHHAGGQTLQPTALVHEAWLRLAGKNARSWNNREHFFRAAAQTMRHILVDISRRKTSLKRGGPLRRSLEDEANLAAPTPDDRLLLVDEALAKLETEDPESAKLVALKFFGGFTNQETARMLGLSERTLERKWTYAKSCLFDLIQGDRDNTVPPTPKPLPAA